MKILTIDYLSDFLYLLENSLSERGERLLFRGQSGDWPLIPGIARTSPTVDKTDTERRMLETLKKEGNMLLSTNIQSDLEYLVVAQHYKMLTRLLDWTNNPFTALWFAISNQYRLNEDSYFYCLSSLDEDLLSPEELRTSPFAISKIKFFFPKYNNNRVMAQEGCFSVHPFNNQKSSYLDLSEDISYKDRISKVRIPYHRKESFLYGLSNLGINHRTIFPDLEGLCTHLNWINFRDPKPKDLLAEFKTRFKENPEQKTTLLIDYVRLRFPNGFHSTELRRGTQIPDIINKMLEKDFGISEDYSQLLVILKSHFSSKDNFINP